MIIQDVHDLGYGIRVGWLNNRGIIYIETHGNISHEAMLVWKSAMFDLMRTQHHNPLAFLHHAQSMTNGLNHILRQTLNEVFSAIPVDRPIYSAICMDSGLVQRLLALLVRSQFSYRPLHRLRIFSDPEEATAWLCEHMNTHSIAC